jgi:hypothetical protein
MRDLGHLWNVKHLQTRIAYGLGDQEPGSLTDGGAEAVEVPRLDEGGSNAEAWQRMGQQIDGPAVERG